MFKKQLSAWQWFSLLLLTGGCIVKNFGQLTDSSGAMTLEHVVNFNLVLILIQVFCSCFAGVFNEYLLKDSTGEAAVHVMIQNMYMYIDSIICNVVVLSITSHGATGEPVESSIASDLMTILVEPSTLILIFNNSLCGIVTSLFLKNLNSILKTFAAAIELVFTAIICWILFYIPIDRFTVISIAIVCYATYLYSKHPLITRPKAESVSYSLLSTDDEGSDRKPRKSPIDEV